MDPKRKIPGELAAVAVICCIGGGVLLLTVAAAAVLLSLHRFPDPAVQALFGDASGRPLLIGEAVGAVLLGVAAVAAGTMTLARARAAGSALRAVIGLAVVCVIADVVVQGWLVVPSLHRLAPSLKQPDSLMYDPRFRPALPIVVGVAVIAGLFAVARTLRRPRVREALGGGRSAV
jgi:hypothetical protein